MTVTRIMYDSTTATDIPRSATCVAGYVDGNYQTVDALRRRFPKATIVTITVLGTPGAHVCDTEPGNIGPRAAVKWAAAEVKAGRQPTLYCMASQWPQIQSLVKKAGIDGHVSYWIAQYDNKAAIPKGAVAKQFADPATHKQGHFDLSVVRDYWPGVDPPPPVKEHPLSRRHRHWAEQLTVAFEKRIHALPDGDRRTLVALEAAVRQALGRTA